MIYKPVTVARRVRGYDFVLDGSPRRKQTLLRQPLAVSDQ